jgi:Putative binding domain, N-terminal
MVLSLLLLGVTAVGCKNDTSTPTGSTGTTSCTVTAGAISASTFGAAGGTGSVPVTAPAGCAWTATSSATFVAISSGATGSGNGTVAFTVAANAGAARSATISISSATNFTITQSAAAPPPQPGTLSAPVPVSPVRGETVNDPRPLLVVNNAAASGNVGTVSYRFEVSDLSTFPIDPARTFTADSVPQGGQTTGWTVNRDLGPDVLWYWHARATDGIATSAYSPTETFRTPTTCTYAISPPSAVINSTSADLTITVTTKNSCAWAATTTSAFITIVSGASGSGSGSVFITISDNVGPERTGTVTIAGLTFTVTQAAP